MTIAAAPTAIEKEKGVYGGGLADKARVIRHCLRTLVTDLGLTDSTLILTNQVYTVIGSYVNGVETPGGGGIKFHSSARLHLRKKGEVTNILPSGGEAVKGIITEIFTVKNKLTLPKQKCLISINGERGFDKYETTVNHLSATKAIRVSGAWKYLSIPVKKEVDGKIVVEYEEKAFQSPEKLKIILDKQPELYDYLDYLVYKYYTDYSPLIKVKIIDKIWKYEEHFFLERKTELTEEEIEIAKLLYRKFNLLVISEKK